MKYRSRACPNSRSTWAALLWRSKGAALRPKTGFAPGFHVWAGADLLLLKDTDTRLDLGAMRLTYE